ncbi:MAG: hypothetical protein RLY49_580 [Candidatus Parcubacteria bacterium]
MPQKIMCPKHQTKLEPDGICHECTLERSEQNAKQFPEFAKMLANRGKGKKKK